MSEAADHPGDIALPSSPDPNPSSSGQATPDRTSAALSRVSLDSTPRTSRPGSVSHEPSRKSSTYEAVDGYLSPPLGSSSSGFDLSQPAGPGVPSPTRTRSRSPVCAVPGSPRILTPRKSRDVARSPPASPSPTGARAVGRGGTPYDIPLPMTPHANGDATGVLGKTQTMPSPGSPTPARPTPPTLDVDVDGSAQPNGSAAESPSEAFESVSLGGETPIDPSPRVESEENGDSEVSLETAPEEGAMKVDKEIIPPAAGEPVRRHAPPAHPHPFPLPSSAGPSSPRNSRSASTTPAPTTSTDPSSTSLPPSASASGSASSPAPPGVAAVAPVAAAAATAAAPHVGGIGVKGPSAFEKVVSHTRPSHLPPKPKEEDESHYHEWEEMMSTARDLEAQKRKRQAAAQLEKEKRLAGNTKRWDALLADPTWSRDKVVVDQGLRQMWFDGIPGYLRGKAWALAIGNPLAMSKDAYKMYSSRAAKAYESGRFPKDIEESMEKEMDQVLPTLKLFIPDSPLRADLKELISSWVVYRSDDGLGYSSHIAFIAAMLLLTSPPAVAFVSMCNLLARPFLRSFFTDTKDEIDAYYRVFENLQADMFPKIYANCKNLGLQLPESYFRSMLVEQVPFEAACRLWDQIVLDGDGYIFRAALAVFGFLEPRLLYPDRDEIESVLEGRNHATLVITERERERARLRGEAYDEEVDGKLSVFGLNEAALFEWIETDQWKESRFERLVVREMPD